MTDYRITEGEENQVARYLERYPFLVPLLQEVRHQLRIHFGVSEVFLEVSADPEGSDETLVATVMSAEEADETHQRLTAFDRWWLLNVHRAELKLLVTVGFI